MGTIAAVSQIQVTIGLLLIVLGVPFSALWLRFSEVERHIDATSGRVDARVDRVVDMLADLKTQRAMLEETRVDVKAQTAQIDDARMDLRVQKAQLDRIEALLQKK
jgi:hypothetical protein